MTYTNTPTLGVSGASGDGDTAAQFNGSTQYLTRAYDANLNPHTFTLDAWVYPTSSGSRRIISTLTSASPWTGFTLGQSSANEFYVVLGDGTSTQRSVNEPAAHAFNQWYHVVATYDGTTLRLYVNGTQVGTPLACSYVATTSNATLVGRDLPGDYWGGKLDEVAIYNGALSSTQITQHYNAATGNGPTDPPTITNTYSYDANGNRISMSDATGTSTYSYDPFDELTSNQNGAGKTVSYTYNDDGRPTGITYPLGAGATWATSDTVTYGYDNADELNSITDFNNNTITIGNTADGLPNSLALGSSGDTITTTYDPTDTPSADHPRQQLQTLLDFAYSDVPSGAIAAKPTHPL